jgi:hypothetical protein
VIYQEQFPNHRIPNIRTIVRIVQHLRDGGSYKHQTQDRGVQRPRRVANMEEDLPVLEDLHVSITFHTVLFGEQLYPYHVKKFSVCNLVIYHVDRNFANGF